MEPNNLESLMRKVDEELDRSDNQIYNNWNNIGVHLSDDYKEYEKAIQCYDKALQINSRSELAWSNKGNALNNLEEYEKAIQCYDKALQINPQFELAWSNKGITLSYLKEYEKAIQCYDKALQINPESVLALNSKGIALSKLKEYEKAIQCYEKALQINPQSGLATLSWNNKGNALSNLKEYEKAIQCYEKALQINPQFELAWNNYEEANENFLINPNYSESQKIGVQLKFCNYSQLRIDNLIQSGKTIEALELVEKLKNNYLSRLLLLDAYKTISPKYDQIQILLNPNTAVIYWHISPTTISTFILKYNQEPIIKTVLFQATSLTDNLQRFESWIDEWLEGYNDYCWPNKHNEQSNSSKIRKNHPWRQEMISQIAELRDILKIKDICQSLDEKNNVKNLILIPHRNLHTLPLETLFPDQYTITRLPSAKAGIDQQAFLPMTNPAILLVEQVKQTKEKSNKRNLIFAQIEAITLKQMYQINHHLQSDISKEQVIENLLNPNINIFHFTGHAHHNTSNPSESALILNNGDHLTMVYIYQQINKSQQYYQLTCLNGCETGITTREDMIDEFIGLASAFLPKTQYVISSLWRVDDRASALLMIEFYRLLQVEKINAIEALNQAKYWLRDLTNGKLADWYDQILVPLLPDKTIQLYLQRESKRLKKFDIMEPPPYQHPYYWAGFIIHGSFV